MGPFRAPRPIGGLVEAGLVAVIAVVGIAFRIGCSDHLIEGLRLGRFASVASTSSDRVRKCRLQSVPVQLILPSADHHGRDAVAYRRPSLVSTQRG
jgi:hypothetical protein